MSDHRKKKPLVPKLRFPEFQDAGEWEVKRLVKIFQERSERNGSGLELLSVTLSDGVVKASQLNRTNNTSADLSNYKKVYPNDIVYNSMRMWQGASGVSKWHGIVSPAYTVIAPLESQYSVFWSYYFKHPESIGKFARFSQGLTSDTWNLKFPAFSAIRMAVPKPNEQEKIADCLSSLDALIEVEAQKCEALKIHKKGLMQLLFPREGETTPRLRFPEFWDTGEWHENGILDIASMKARVGWQNLRQDEHLETGEYYLVTGTDFVLDRIDWSNAKYVDYERYIQDKNIILRDKDILITKDGSVGKVAFLDNLGDKKATLNNGIFRIRVENESPKFIFYTFLSVRFKSFLQRLSGGSSIKHLYQKDFESYEVAFPKLEEQEKIADCLSSLDSLIAAQSEKLDALTAHKKGLMQQLFPQEVG